MTTKQKCEKLAKVLETVAEKLRDPKLGPDLWEQNEPTMQSLVGQVHIFLKRAMDLDSSDLPSTAKRKRTSKDINAEKDRDDRILNEWPDTLS